MYTATRVTDIKNKSVEQLKNLRDLGIREISLGVESGDDWTLERISKGYRAADILEQCRKLEEAGIRYWVTFLNGVAGKSHSRDHAIHSAEVFNQLHPMVVGTGGLTLFSGTPLLAEAEKGDFDPLDEKGLMEELLLFLETLECDSRLITHHTISMDLNDDNFLSQKPKILSALRDGIAHLDMDVLARRRSNKLTL